MTVYERIRQCRLNKGMTQSELAKIMGYTDRSTIAKIETGKVDSDKNVTENANKMLTLLTKC